MTEEQKLPELKEAMSVAQFKAITALLAGEYLYTGATSKEITSERLYIHSHYYGTSRHHMISLEYDGDVTLDQNDKGEKYQQRVTFEAAEIEPLLRQLLLWHFAKAATLNDGSFSIAAERFSPVSEEAFIKKQPPFEEGIENAYSPRPDDGPIII